MAEPLEIRDPEAGAAVLPRVSRRTLVRWAIAGVLAAVVLAVVVPVFSMLQPGYYQRYPSLRVRMANWQNSTHARVACAGCHVDPGIAGLTTFAVRAVPAFYSQVLFGPNPGNLLRTPSRAACQECHTGYRQVSPNGDLLIPHRAHVEVLGIDCAVCHKDLVHSLNTQGFNKPSMSTCLKLCHDGRQATDKCVKCHTRKEVPANHKSKDWLDVHSKAAASIDCGACHGWTPDFCRACHLNRPPSHVGNWKALHALRAKARGTKGCTVCHDATFCRRCH